MITSAKEYKQYVKADIAAHGLQHVSLYNWLRIDQLRFQLRLRRLEYLTNCQRWRLRRAPCSRCLTTTWR